MNNIIKPERDLDLILLLTKRMRELREADIYGIWDWDSMSTALNQDEAIYVMLAAEEEREMTREAKESAAAYDEFVRQFAKPILSDPVPPHLTPRPSAYDIPPNDSYVVAKDKGDPELAEPYEASLLQRVTQLQHDILSIPERVVAELQMAKPLMTLEQNPDPFGAIPKVTQFNMEPADKTHRADCMCRACCNSRAKTSKYNNKADVAPWTDSVSKLKSHPDNCQCPECKRYRTFVINCEEMAKRKRNREVSACDSEPDATNHHPNCACPECKQQRKKKSDSPDFTPEVLFREKNTAKEVLLERLRFIDPTSSAYYDIMRAIEKLSSPSTR